MIGLLFALSAGIATGKYWQGREDLLLLVLAASMWLSFLAARQKLKLTWFSFGLTFFLFGGWRFLSVYALPPDDVSFLTGENVKIFGTVIEEPRLTRTNEGFSKIRYLLEVEGMITPTGEKPLSGCLWAHTRAAPDAPLADIGDRLTIGGKIHRPQHYGNPGQPDSLIMLRSRGISAQIMGNKSGAIIEKFSKVEPKFYLLRRLARLREHYRRTMEQAMPKEAAAAIFAVMFGGYTGLSAKITESFTATGIVHILSVSGTHVALLAAFMVCLGNLLRLSKTRLLILLLVSVIGYGALAGGGAPIIRAGLMGGLAFMAAALGRPKDSRRLLLIVGLLILTISPLNLWHIGFQLSFVSTAGLLFLSPTIKSWLAPLNWPKLLAESFSLTSGVTLAALPILAWYFNTVSLVSFAANLLIVPWVELLLIIALIGGIVALFVPPLGLLVFSVDYPIWQGIYKVTVTLAALPGHKIYVPTFSWLGVALYYVFLSALAVEKEKRARLADLWQQYRATIAVVILGSAIVCGIRFARQTPEIAVHFIDVGQGDAALVVTPHGKAIMFDTGGTRSNDFDIGAKVDLPYLRHYGVHELAAIFLTHAHEDHAGGAGSILRSLPVGRVFTADEGREVYASIFARSGSAPDPKKIIPAGEGQALTIDGVTVKTVYAPSAVGKTGNEASNVYRVSYRDFSVLITGDVETAGENDILAAKSNIRCSVLKVPHHGSRTSCSAEFLRACEPQAAVFSVGRDNAFGHPHQEVLERVKNSGAKIFRTDEDGAVVFYSDGQNMRATTHYDRPPSP